jgi:hypothetical protein
MLKKYLLIFGLIFFTIFEFSCTKEFEKILKEKVVVVRSKSFADIEFSDNTISKTIQPDLSIINSGVPDTYIYSAYSYGKTSRDTQLGEKLTWGSTLSISSDTTMEELSTSNEYFFLFIKNESSTSYGSIVINYGNSDEKTEYIGIPASNGTTYSVAYYKVHSDTKIRLYDQNNSSSFITATAGINFNFTNTENQYVLLTITPKGTDINQTNEIPSNIVKPNNL